MSGVNKVILLGNLGKDPEIRHLENGRAVTNFTLATSEVYKNREGNKVTNTEWHNVVLWTPLAEVAEKFLKKGSQVYIEGKITTRSYDDKDGNKRYITEVVGRELTLVGGRPDGGGGAPEQQNSSQAEPAGMAQEPTDLDDLPF